MSEGCAERLARAQPPDGPDGLFLAELSRAVSESCLGVRVCLKPGLHELPDPFLALGALDRGDEIVSDISATEQDFQSATASHQPWKARHGAAPRAQVPRRSPIAKEPPSRGWRSECHRPVQARCQHLDVRITLDRGNHFVVLRQGHTRQYGWPKRGMIELSHHPQCCKLHLRSGSANRSANLPPSAKSGMRLSPRG